MEMQRFDFDLDRISFAEWLIELDRIATEEGYKNARITKVLGQFLWYPFFEVGMSPAEALLAAAYDGSQFERDYADI